jgi:hypothetical protein
VASFTQLLLITSRRSSQRQASPTLFTHIHAFWVAGLLLALIDLPDFGTPLGRIAGSLEKIADRPLDAASPATKSRLTRDPGAADFRGNVSADAPPGDEAAAETPGKRIGRSAQNQELINA